MKRTSKKLIAMLLVLMMVVTLLPTFAAAEGDVKNYVSIERNLIGYDPWTAEHDVTVQVTVDGEEVASGEDRMYTSFGVLAGNGLTVTLADTLKCKYQLEGMSLTQVNSYTSKINVKMNGDKTEFTGTVFDPHIDGGLLSKPIYTIKLSTKPAETHADEVRSEAQSALAKCEEDGKDVYVCSVCGKVLRTETVAKLGHDIKHTEAYLDEAASTLPTCEEPGTLVYKCSRCDYTEKVDAEPIDHDYEWTHVDGTENADSMHSGVCKNDPSHLADAEACTFTSTEVSADHVTTVTYTCSVCGYSYDETMYDLCYDVNGGADGPADAAKLLPQTGYGLDLSTVPTHENVDGTAVVFMGWTAEKCEDIFAKGDEAPVLLTEVDITDAPVTVYAAYGFDADGNGNADVLDKDITLNYDAGEGSDAPAAQTLVADPAAGTAEFTVSDTVPTRSEYTFKGWKLEGDEKVYAAGDKLVLDADATLVAVWEQNPLVKYTVSYDANGGKNAPAAQSVESRTGSGVLTLTKDQPSYEGYVFAGWSQNKTGNAQFKPGDNVELKGDVTLYAVWAKPVTTPKTGDESNVALWASLAALSVMAMGAVLVLGKKKASDK